MHTENNLVTSEKQIEYLIRKMSWPFSKSALASPLPIARKSNK
jgi:hypothetical protein